MQSPYSVNKLMEETRRLAAEFYRTAQKPLPVSSELALYDAMRLMQLKPSDMDGVDAINHEGHGMQIKSRVIFDAHKSNQRVGQLKESNSNWQYVLLVLLNQDYETFAIYQASREALIGALSENTAKQNKRGAISVSKFKYIGSLVWSLET